jgi:hypothetical protein
MRLPARIIRDNGTSIYAICCCTIDAQNGKIYHRGYELSSIDAIYQQFGIAVSTKEAEATEQKLLNKNTDDNNFVVQSSRFRNRSYIVQDDSCSVILLDPVNKLYLQLFHRQR